MPNRINIADLQDSLCKEWPEVAQCVLWAVPYLYRARDHLYDDLCRCLGPLGLLPADVDILVALRVQPPPRQLSPTVLYRSLFLSSGGMTKILGRLERDGLILRLRHPSDGRSRLVRLTGEGERRLDQAMQLILDHQQVMLGPLSADEQRELTRLLVKLVSATEPGAKASAPVPETQPCSI